MSKNEKRWWEIENEKKCIESEKRMKKEEKEQKALFSFLRKFNFIWYTLCAISLSWLAYLSIKGIMDNLLEAIGVLAFIIYFIFMIFRESSSNGKSDGNVDSDGSS